MDNRPSRPNSIGLRRNYPDQVDTGYGPRRVHSQTQTQYTENYNYPINKEVLWPQQQNISSHYATRTQLDNKNIIDIVLDREGGVILILTA